MVLVPEFMSADAFVMVCRPVYRTDLTHVEALFFFFFRKVLVLVTVFVANKLACLYSVVKRELSERMWHFALPVCDGRSSLI